MLLHQPSHRRPRRRSVGLHPRPRTGRETTRTYRPASPAQKTRPHRFLHLCSRVYHAAAGSSVGRQPIRLGQLNRDRVDLWRCSDRRRLGLLEQLQERRRHDSVFDGPQETCLDELSGWWMLVCGHAYELLVRVISPVPTPHQPLTIISSSYLPIYFQAVRQKSPSISGVFLLPSILSQLFSGVLAGKLMGVFGYYLPWGVASAVFQAVGYGLLSTIHPHTGPGNWISYQIIAGIGRGFGMTVPMIAVQNNLAPKLIPVVMSLLMACQTYFAALFLSFGDTIFINSLRSILEKTLTQGQADSIAHAGAYGFIDIVPTGQLGTVLVAYAESIDRVFYMAVGLAGVCFTFAWGLGWVDIRKKETPVAKKAEQREEGEQEAEKVIASAG